MSERAIGEWTVRGKSASGLTWYLLFGGVVATLLLGALAKHWYSASLQSAVYAREGIEVTTWEVFMGARPAERTINLK